MVGAAVGLGDDVVNFQDAEGELTAAAVAAAFLLAEEDVLVLAVGAEAGSGRSRRLLGCEGFSQFFQGGLSIEGGTAR